MIRLTTVIEAFGVDFLAHYRGQLRPEHYRALAAMKHCRTQASPKMQVQCTGCAQQKLVPHSCGHRHCPHCQHHESQQWLERQMQKLVPAEYFLLTFTLPAEFRALAFAQQRVVYELLLRCCWETVRTRTLDFRLTARKVRKSTKPTYDKSLTIFFVGPEDYGSATWRLFWSSCVVFTAGVCLLVVAVGNTYADRLF